MYRYSSSPRNVTLDHIIHIICQVKKMPKFQFRKNKFSLKSRQKNRKDFRKASENKQLADYSILSHAECSVCSRTSKTVRTCYCDLTAIIYLIPAGRLIPLVVTSFPVLSFHNLVNSKKTILAHPCSIQLTDPSDCLPESNSFDLLPSSPATHPNSQCNKRSRSRRLWGQQD